MKNLWTKSYTNIFILFFHQNSVVFVRSQCPAFPYGYAKEIQRIKGQRGQIWGFTC